MRRFLSVFLILLLVCGCAKAGGEVQSPQPEVTMIGGYGAANAAPAFVAAGSTELSPRLSNASADGYSVSFTMSEIRSKFVDETVPGKALYMILAWEEDSLAIPLMLVMGQSIEGEYNRQFWVREVITIEVRT